MTVAGRFLFDDDFGPAAKQAAPAISPADHQVAIAEAEMRGYRSGVNAAEAQARTDVERRIAAAFERIASALEQMRTSLKAVEDRFEAEAVEVALAVGRKLAGDLIAREPFAEVAALADQCFRELLAAPHLVVRVNGALYREAKDRLEEIARSRGFDGRLVVMAEGDIPLGDCRIEWADGGLKRDRAATEAAIADAVGRYIDSRRGPMMP
ncbi:MAG TPA: FliH/SctL family protein [Xanthobacteraceae bacterium]|nr:FliH/SctL family protein [Xanthobacteraceae bacterium]